LSNDENQGAIAIVEVVSGNNMNPVDDATMKSSGVRDVAGGGGMNLRSRIRVCSPITRTYKKKRSKQRDFAPWGQSAVGNSCIGESAKWTGVSDSHVVDSGSEV
jgi:hypothetical protein